MTSIAGLESFLAVARCGNLTTAARELHVTQPGLTARLQRLEAELGTELLVRLPRGVRLTGRGPRAAALRRARASRASSRAPPRCATSCAAPAGASRSAPRRPSAPTCCRAPCSASRASTRPSRWACAPGTPRSCSSSCSPSRSRSRIVRALRHPQIESTPLYEDEVVLATHPAHPLAGDHAVRVEQLGDQDLILFDPSSSYHELTSAMFRAAGVSPRGVDGARLDRRRQAHGAARASASPCCRAARSATSSPTARWPPSRSSRRRRCAARSWRSAAATPASSRRRWPRSSAASATSPPDARQAGLYSPNISRIAPQISPSVARRARRRRSRAAH